MRFKDGNNSKSLEAESNNLNSYYKQANKQQREYITQLKTSNSLTIVDYHMAGCLKDLHKKWVQYL